MNCSSCNFRYCFCTRRSSWWSWHHSLCMGSFPYLCNWVASYVFAPVVNRSQSVESLTNLSRQFPHSEVRALQRRSIKIEAFLPWYRGIASTCKFSSSPEWQSLTRKSKYVVLCIALQSTATEQAQLWPIILDSHYMLIAQNIWVNIAHLPSLQDCTIHMIVTYRASCKNPDTNLNDVLCETLLDTS